MERKGDTFPIYGAHAVKEALLFAPHALTHLSLAASAREPELVRLAKAAGIPVEQFSAKALPRGVDPNAAHQGISGVVASQKLMRAYPTFLEDLSVTADTALVLLGEIEDPQNVGAIIRSAAAFGAAGVLIPAHRQAQITGSIVKVSAGMAFRIPLVAVGNINTTVRDLKERGFWIYGLAGDAPQAIDRESFDAPSVFILGNEGTGMREKTRELCDVTLKIPLDPRCESLNVAASAAVALYAWSRQHPAAPSSSGSVR